MKNYHKALKLIEDLERTKDHMVYCRRKWHDEHDQLKKTFIIAHKEYMWAHDELIRVVQFGLNAQDLPLTMHF